MRVEKGALTGTRVCSVKLKPAETGSHGEKKHGLESPWKLDFGFIPIDLGLLTRVMDEGDKGLANEAQLTLLLSDKLVNGGFSTLKVKLGLETLKDTTRSMTLLPGSLAVLSKPVNDSFSHVRQENGSVAFGISPLGWCGISDGLTDKPAMDVVLTGKGTYGQGKRIKIGRS